MLVKVMITALCTPDVVPVLGMSRLTLEMRPSVAVHPVDNNARDPAIVHNRVKVSAFIPFNMPF
jgi:hypothetical protein